MKKRDVHFIFLCGLLSLTPINAAKPDTSTFVIQLLHEDEYVSGTGVGVMKQHKIIRAMETYEQELSVYSKTAEPFDIDFSKNVILLVDLGYKNTGEYSIVLGEAVSITDKIVKVTVKYSASCIVTLGVTNPYAMWRLPTTQVVLIQEEWVEQDCRVH